MSRFGGAKLYLVGKCIQHQISNPKIKQHIPDILQWEHM